MLNSSPTVKYRPLTVSGPPPPTLAKPAGIWKRLHILKVILVVGFLLTILNLFNYGFDKKFEKLSFLRNNNNITQQLQNPLHTTSRAISPSAFNNFGPKRLRPNVENDLIRPEPAKEDGLVLRNDRSNATRTIIPTISGSRVFKNSFKNSTFTTESSSTQDHSQTDLQEQPLAIIKSVPNEVQVASSTPSRPPSPLVPQTEKRTLQENSVVDLKDHLILSQSQQRPTIPSILKLGAPNSINQEEEKERLRTKTDPYLVLNATARTKFSGYIQTTSAQSVTFLSKLMTKLGINACPECPPDLHGPLEVNLTKDTVAAVETHLRRFLLPGGWYRPPECNAKDRVAIIIPFRDREEHLPILLKNLHPMLMRQQVNYGIFVVEETMADPFNRASLMNIGFLEASKMHNWDCFIFHDVDLIPLDDRNLYRCPEQPRHMSVAIDVFDYKLPYFTIFGGVSALTKQQFHSVNGFSNLFWGWGGEDDDMSNRLRFMGYHISRYPMNIARYTMLNHPKAKPNPKRYEKLSNGLKRYENDGLNSVKYQLVDNKKFPLFTWILVKLQPEQSVVGKLEPTEPMDYPILKYLILLMLATLLICIFKVLLL